MNTNMYENENTTENIARLKKQGYKIIEPISGRLACGDVGKGKMAEPETIVKAIEDILTPNQDFEGVRMLITAGSTEEKSTACAISPITAAAKWVWQLRKPRYNAAHSSR